MRLALPWVAQLVLVPVLILQMKKTRMTQALYIFILLFRLGVFGSSLLLGFQYLSMFVQMFGYYYLFCLLAGLGCHLVAQRNPFAQTCSIWPLPFLLSVAVDSNYVSLLFLFAKSRPLLPLHVHDGVRLYGYAALLIIIHVQEHPS